MTQVYDDSRDVTESVGMTALEVAMAHVAESDCSCPLFTDRYAQLFVDAATRRGWDSSAVAQRLPIIRGYAAVRTKWFDEYFIAAGANGIDQAVILAAGLDARAWRLPWVHGSAVYEIDHPQVLAFKADALATRSARPATRYQPVSVDVRADWPTALRQAGFDPSTPTAWSAEGLLPDLTAAEQDLLLQQIVALSAPGSRIAVESLRPCERLTEWLTDQGWEVTATEAVKLMERYGRPPEAEVAEIATRSVFIEARLSMVRGLA